MFKAKLAVLGMVAIAGVSTLYPTAAVITDVTDNIVTIETAGGIAYQYEGAGDDMEGDIVALIMYNNGTPHSILDDVIISHRYSGFWMDK